VIAALRAFFGGITGYAYLALGIVVLGLLGSVAFLWEVHKADAAEARASKQNLAFVTNALKQSEADKADLAREVERLNQAVKREQDIQAQLQKDKQALSRKLDELKPTLPKEDQSCLDRSLPAPLLDLLRDGPADSNAVRH
jgi:septal ring factor EnvC (AmiA/AmiB activator)